MKRRILSLILILALLVSMPAVCPAVQAAELPTCLTVEPSSGNRLPAAVGVYQASDIFLPGNADPDACFLSWDGGLSAICGGKVYDSGELPIPAPGRTARIQFTKDGSVAAYDLTTYQGSASVAPVFIEIDETQGTIAAMETDSAHETECSGEIFVDGERFDLPKMKGRGNATWYMAQEKKPYNITLGTKTVLLGLDCGKTKKYSLLANIADHSLLRNQIGFELASAMGIGQDSVSVDLWLNGDYRGVYLLTPKTDSYVTDTGFSVEIDNYTEPPIEEGGDPSFELLGSGSHYDRITVKKIGDDLLGEAGESTENLYRASGEIRTYLQEVWSAIYSPAGYSSAGKYYTDYIDVESFAAMYLMHEFVKSYDVKAGSILFHRDGTGESDKLFGGPIWDLDNALGATSAHDLPGANGWFIPTQAECLFKALSTHDDFMEAVGDLYNRSREAFDAMPARLAVLASGIEASADMNFRRITREGYNNSAYGSAAVLDAGTDYEQSYRATNTWADYVENLRTYLTVRARFFRDNLAQEGDGIRVSFAPDSHVRYEAVDGTQFGTYTLAESGGEVLFRVKPAGGWRLGDVTAAPDTHYEDFAEISEGVYCLRGVTGAVRIAAGATQIVCAHEFEGGVCTLCGREGFRITFDCDSHCRVIPLPDAYARSDGKIDLSGSGEVRFTVEVDEGFRLSTAIGAPRCYQSLIRPADGGVWRLTGVSGDLTLSLRTKLRSPDTADVLIDFTDPAASSLFEIIGPDTAAITPGEGLHLTTTKDAFEPATGQLSGAAATTPRDLVKVPVSGDWTATLEFTLDVSRAANGYYQYFGFYAMQDHDNAVGIRGGEGAMQDFLRIGGGITEEAMDSTPGLSEGGRFWYRIVKECGSYACFRSGDGEQFDLMFEFPETGIEAEYIAIDAYTGMTDGYDFTLRALTLEGIECPHCFAQTVTEPTCTEAGAITYTCTLCGGSYQDVLPAPGHAYSGGICTRCGETAPDSPHELVCPGARFADMPAYDNWAHEGIDWCLHAGLMNGVSDERFDPDGTVTRAQLVTILHRAAGEPWTEYKGTFSDVPYGLWYTRAVQWAADAGIVNGVAPGRFDPMAPITREQIAAILYRCAGSPEARGSLESFPDFADVHPYAADAMCWAIGEGVINGAGTRLSPRDNARRSQIAAIIMRYMMQ